MYTINAGAWPAGGCGPRRNGGQATMERVNLAYLGTAEVARLPADRSGGKLALTLRVPMDSSYLFEPDTTTYPFVPGLPGAPRRTAPEVELEPFDHIADPQATGV